MIDNTETSAGHEKTDTKPADNENVVNQTADTGSDTPDNIPYARFNDMNKKHTAKIDSLQKKLNKVLSDNEEKAIKETNDLTEAKTKLAEQNDLIKELQSYKGVIEEERAKQREELLGNLSDDDRELYGSLSNEQLQNHLTKHNANKSVNTDKSQAVRGSAFPDDKNIFEMDKDERKKNWTEYLKKYTNK